MANGFVISGQVVLQPPSAANLAAISNAISSHLKAANGNINVNIGANTQKGLDNLNKSLKRTSQYANEAEKNLFNFGKQSAYAVQRFFAFTVATTAFFGFTRSFAKGIKDAIEFEREMIKIRQVTNRSLTDLKDFSNEVTHLATTLGVSSKKILEVGLVLAQAGLSAKQTTVALEALAKSELAPTFDDMISTSEAAIAVFQQFKIKAEELEGVLGSINAVSARFAVEASDISAVIRRTGGAFAAAGGNLNELIALFTSVRQTTRESAESIATGFRTIFTRIQRLRTIDFLSNVGIQLRDMQGQFVGPLKAVEELHNALTQIRGTDPRFSQIIEELGGFRQVSKVIPLIQQFAVTQKALRVAQQGTNSLTEDAAKSQDALAIKITRVREEFAALIRQLTGTTAFKSMIDVALKLASAFIAVAKTLENVLPLLTIFSGHLIGKALNPLAAGAKSVFGFGPKGFNRGGTVPGSGNTDSVPAKLTPGEFVINKRAAGKIGTGNLNRLNKGGRVRFADAGAVESVDTIIQELLAPASTGRFSNPHTKSILNKYGFNPNDKSIVSIKSIAQDLSKTRPRGIGNISNIKAIIAGLPKTNSGEKLTKAQIASNEFDVLLGSNDEANPTFSGLFLEKNAGVKTVRYNETIPGNIKDIVEAKAKKQKLSLSGRTLANFHFGSLAPNSGKLIKENITHGFTSAISDLAAEFGSGLGVDPSDRKTIDSIAQKANLSGVIGGIFEGFVSTLSNNTNKGTEEDVFDIVGDNISENPGITKLFGKIPSSIKYADVKTNTKKSADLLNKASKIAARQDDSLINFIPSRPIPNIANTTQGEELERRQPFATGGLVPGVGNSDTVKANLTPGEFVIRKKAVQAIGVSKLAGMNKYNAGGEVFPKQSLKAIISRLPNKTSSAAFLLEELIDSPNYDTIGRHIPIGSDYLGSGIEAVALKTPANQVVRLGPTGMGLFGDGSRRPGLIPDRPKDKKFLQAIKTITSGIFKLELLPFAKVLTGLNISDTRKEKVQRGLFNRFVSQGELPTDLHYSNIGRVGKKFKVIDPDVLANKEELEYYRNIAAGAGPNVSGNDRFAQITSAIRKNPDKFGTLPASSRISLGNISSSKKPDDISTLYQLNQMAGGGNVDSVPALLTPGEFVINKRAASKIGATNLNRLNNADKVKRFNKGGVVQNFADGGEAQDRTNKLIGLTIGAGFIANLVSQTEAVGKEFKDLISILTGVVVSFNLFNAGLKSFAQTPEKFNKENIQQKFAVRNQTTVANIDSVKEPLRQLVRENIKREKDFPRRTREDFAPKSAALKQEIRTKRDRASAIEATDPFRGTQHANFLTAKLRTQANRAEAARNALIVEYKNEKDFIKFELTGRRKHLKAIIDLEKQKRRELAASQKAEAKEIKSAENREKNLNKVIFGTAALSSAAIGGGGFLSNRGNASIKSSGGTTGKTDVVLGGTLNDAGLGAIAGAGVGQLFGPLGAAIGGIGGGAIGAIIGFARATEEATKAIEKAKFDKQIEGVFNRLDRVVSGKSSSLSSLSDLRITAKSFDDRLLRTSGPEDFESTIGQRKEFAEKLQVILDDIAKNSSNFGEFITKLGGDNKANVLFDSLSQSIGSSTADLRKEFTSLINVTSKTTDITKNINDAKEVEFARLRLLSDLNKSITRASSSLDADVISTISGEAKISSTATPGSSSFIQSFSSFFGDQAKSFTNEIEQSIKAQDVIARALVNVRNVNPLEDENIDANSAILSQLDQLGITDSNVRRIVQAEISGIIGPEGKDAKLFATLNDDIEGVTNKIVEALDTVPKIFFDFTAKLISVNNEYLTAQRSRIEKEKELIKGVQDISDIRKSAEEFTAKAENRTVDFGKLAGLNEDKRLANLTAGNGAALGLAGFAGSSPADLAKQIEKSRTKIETNTLALASGGADRGKLSEEIKKETEIVQRLNSTLEYMADTGNAVAIAQAKFDKELSDRQVKQGFAESFVFSDTAGRRDINKNIATTLAVLKTKDLSTIPASSRAGVSSLLDTFKDVNLDIFGGKTGGEIKLEITKNELKAAGFSDKELEGITAPGANEEKARLKVLDAFKLAEDSRAELNKLLGKQLGDLNKLLDIQFAGFLTQLGDELKESAERDIAIRSSEFVGTGVKRASIEDSFSKLEGLGVSRNVLENKGELIRFRTAIASNQDLQKNTKSLTEIEKLRNPFENLVKKLPDDGKQIITDFLDSDLFENSITGASATFIKGKLGFVNTKSGDAVSNDNINSSLLELKNLGIDVSAINTNKDLAFQGDELKTLRSKVLSFLQKSLPDSPLLVNEIKQDFEDKLSKQGNTDFSVQVGRSRKLGEAAISTTVINLVKTIDENLKAQQSILKDSLKEGTDLSQFGPIDPANIAKIDEILSRLPENLDFKALNVEVDIAKQQFDLLNKAITPTIDFFTTVVDAKRKADNAQIQAINAQRASASKYKSVDAPSKKDGIIPRFAQGGTVPGTGNNDSVSARLTPGEFVVNKRAAMKHGGLLKAINFADGGEVGFLGRYLLERQKRAKNIIPSKKGISDFDFSRNDYGGLKQQAIRELGFEKVNPNEFSDIKNYSKFKQIKERTEQLLAKQAKGVQSKKALNQRNIQRAKSRKQSDTIQNIRLGIPGFSGSGPPPKPSSPSLKFQQEFPEFAFFEGITKFDEATIRYNLARDKQETERNRAIPSVVKPFKYTPTKRADLTPLDDSLLLPPDISPDPNSTKLSPELLATLGKGEAIGGLDGLRKRLNRNTFSSLTDKQRESIKSRTQARRELRSKRLGRRKPRRIDYSDIKNRDSDFLNSINNENKAKQAMVIYSKLPTFAFNTGGKVPAMLTPGELVFSPDAVKSVGLSNLEKMNDVSKVPGVGNRDSVPANLNAGSFVLNKKASNRVGMANGGQVSSGTSSGTVLNSDSFNSAVVNFSSAANKLAQSLDNMPREISFIGRMTHEVIVTGGEALSNSIQNKLVPVFTEMVENIINKQIEGIKKDFGMQNG